MGHNKSQVSGPGLACALGLSLKKLEAIFQDALVMLSTFLHLAINLPALVHAIAHRPPKERSYIRVFVVPV
jgi:hypothetical protein